MNILPGFKLCRNKLHQYPADKRQCPECKSTNQRLWDQQNREKKRNYYERNREKRREYNRQWYKNNVEKQKEYSHNWYAENSSKAREYMRQWYLDNREQRRNWCKQNPEKARANTSRRRARKKQATPPWANQDAINAIYAEAVRLEQETGIKHHVDHIYPLQSKYLCGLHVAENLQVIPESENLSKSNRTWPGQLDCQKLPIKKVFTPEQIALAQERTDPI